VAFFTSAMLLSLPSDQLPNPFLAKIQRDRRWLLGKLAALVRAFYGKPTSKHQRAGFWKNSASVAYRFRFWAVCKKEEER